MCCGAQMGSHTESGVLYLAQNSWSMRPSLLAMFCSSSFVWFVEEGGLININAFLLFLGDAGRGAIDGRLRGPAKRLRPADAWPRVPREGG